MTNNTALYVNRRQESNWREQGRADAIDGFPPPLHWPLQYAEGYAKYVGIQYTLETRGQHKPMMNCECQPCIRFYATGELPPIVYICHAKKSDHKAAAYSQSEAVLRLVCYMMAMNMGNQRIETPVAYTNEQIEELFNDVSKVQP